MNAESIVQLVLAGGGTSVAALLFQSFVNRSKNKVDVQIAVNAMAKDWLDKANSRLSETENQNTALQTTVFSLRSELFDVKDLVGDMLEDLHDHPKAPLWQARFDKIGA